MKTKIFLLAAATIMLAACSDDMGDSSSLITADADGQVPLTFEAYVNRTATRAGALGSLTTAGANAGEASLENEGFGVIAYYTDDDLYSPIYQPNFMYNTQVKKNGVGAWAYTPVRYWPNETGQNAVSDGVDRLSFFAYAPWTEVTPATGIVTGDATTGIVALSRNTATGDPLVKYYVDLDPARQVDFCWGVANTAFTASTDAGNPNTIAAGTPYIDVMKPNVTSKINFNFKHALAALNVQVDADVDVVNAHDGSDNHDNTLAAETKVYVRQVAFEGFVTKGAFNLNTSKATWYDLAGQNYIDGGTVSIYDGRTNGREAISESANESPATLNADITQRYSYDDIDGDDDYWTTNFPGETKPMHFGVTNEAVNLFASSTPTSAVYVIPSGQPLKVTVVYDVETVNPKLNTLLSDGKTHGVSVENKITKNITLTDGTAMKLESGKTYTLHLHLGLASVNFDANVSETWDAESANGDLPFNVKVDVQQVNLFDKTDSQWKPSITATMLTGVPETLLMQVLPNEADQSVTWTSSNEAIATVDDFGKVTGVAAGTCTITVASVEDPTKIATCELTVEDPILINSLTLDPRPTLELNIDKLDQVMTATIAPADASKKELKWTSSDESVLTFTQTDNEHITLTPVAKGTATIRVEATDGSGKYDECVVTVKEFVPVVGVTISAGDHANFTLRGDASLNTFPMEATVTGQGGEEPTDPSLTWEITAIEVNRTRGVMNGVAVPNIHISTDKDEVATINASTGALTCISPGGGYRTKVTIRATANDYTNGEIYDETEMYVYGSLEWLNANRDNATYISQYVGNMYIITQDTYGDGLGNKYDPDGTGKFCAIRQDGNTINNQALIAYYNADGISSVAGTDNMGQNISYSGNEHFLLLSCVPTGNGSSGTITSWNAVSTQASSTGFGNPSIVNATKWFIPTTEQWKAMCYGAQYGSFPYYYANATLRELTVYYYNNNEYNYSSTERNASSGDYFIWVDEDVDGGLCQISQYGGSKTSNLGYGRCAFAY